MLSKFGLQHRRGESRKLVPVPSNLERITRNTFIYSAQAFEKRVLNNILNKRLMIIGTECYISINFRKR
jgi:hypothetical protein